MRAEGEGRDSYRVLGRLRRLRLAVLHAANRGAAGDGHGGTDGVDAASDMRRVPRAARRFDRGRDHASCYAVIMRRCTNQAAAPSSPTPLATSVATIIARSPVTPQS